MQRWRASSLFQPSNLAAAITATLDPAPGEPSHLFGAIMSFPHTVVARTVAVLGHDFIMVDAQHTAINAENLVQIIQTINLASEGKTIAVVRIATPDSELLTHALDAGAGGIIFAHVDTAEQAAECVAKTKYAYSGGDRSCSPSALTAGATDMAPSGTSHYTVSDENIAVICQIESTLALENLDAIAATQGVTSLMLGPTDLRVSMGLPARLFGQHDEPRFLEAIDQLLRVSKKYWKPLMCVAFKVEAKSDGWINKFQLLITSADMASVVKSHRQDLANAKEMVAAYKKLNNGHVSTNGNDKENSMNGYNKH